MQLQSDSDNLADKVRRNLGRVICLRDTLRELAPAAVVSFGDTMNVRALLASFGLGIPVFVCERTDPRQHLLPWPWRALRRLIYPLATCVVVQTESVAGWARGLVPDHRVRVVPNPVRPVQELAARPEALGPRRTVIAVGRLGREKGFDILLCAYARSGLPRAMWQLVILGNGSERESLLQQVVELDLQGSVLMPGVVKNPEQWLQHAELFVLSSRFEGFPNALLEAMQCGLPVAVFDCPSGPGEIVQHEETGLLVPPGNVEALAAAISRLASEADLRRHLGAAAAADVTTRFSLERISSMWEEMLIEFTVRS
jgi:glycosyltransferase involved in cell wall biosynthesis